jgi:hypothetical protein
MCSGGNEAVRTLHPCKHGGESLGQISPCENTSSTTAKAASVTERCMADWQGRERVGTSVDLVKC